MDLDFVRKCQRGDPAALAELVDQMQGPLTGYLIKMTRDRVRAEDALQETMLRALRALPDWKPTGSFEGWFFTIARNCAMDILRERPMVSLDGEERPGDAIPGTDEAPEERVDRAILGGRLREALDGLPVEQREVVSLRVYGGLSFKEIAKVTGCPLNTALGRMRYALLNLKKVLAGVVVEESP
ncbi:MAG: sigma-70 family RNA polymerase sigma factor [Planctomycetes bacterium]|nr:sigma-70 family RNA polymerase sigma factor [Planctomycetota bacterium]